MRRKTVLGVVLGSGLLLGVVPFAVAGAQEGDDPEPRERSGREVFWLAEETDARFVTRSGEVPDDGGGAFVELTAELSGAAELDPDSLEPGAGDADGAGSATITLGEDGSVCWAIDVTNITLPAVAAHIHEGTADVNGPVVVPLGGPARNGTSIGCGTADAALVEAIAGDPAGYYVNVHTTDFPAGAVRGQLAGAIGDLPEVGDHFFLAEDLFASDAERTKGDRIGHSRIQCTYGVDLSLQCDGTAFLDGRGQVHLTATVPFTGEPTPFEVAVVGGTGDFATAGGDATRTEEAAEDGSFTNLYALRLVDLDDD